MNKSGREGRGGWGEAGQEAQGGGWGGATGVRQGGAATVVKERVGVAFS